MPNKDGFYVDDRPDTNNTRCMKNCKNASEIKVILGPKYSLGKILESSPNETQEQDNEGKSTYESVCKVCHATGVAEAPKFGDTDDWADRSKQDKQTIYAHAINGLNGMPAKGGHPDLSDETIKKTVDYMLRKLEKNK